MQKDLITKPEVRARRHETMSRRWRERMDDAEFATSERRRRADREAGRRDADPTIVLRSTEISLDRKSTIDGRAMRLISSTKLRCRKKSIAFNLTTDWLVERLTRGVCEVSGLPFEMDARKGRSPLSPSIDRIVPSLGYVEDNCRLIAFSLNAAFGNWGDDAFERVALAWIAGRSGRSST